MALKEMLTKKIGPLPVWGYGAIAAGGTFIILKRRGAGSAAGGSDQGGAGQTGGAGSGINGSFKGTSNITSTYSGDQTFGGGALGFLGGPWPGLGNMFTHLHHDGDRWRYGGRDYDGRGFRHHGWDNDGRRRRRDDDDDRRRGHRERGGFPRGFGEGHYSPRRGDGSRFASSFNPRNSGNRGTRWGGLNSDARPTYTSRER